MILFRCDGGLGKKFAIVGAVDRLVKEQGKEILKEIGIIDHYKQVYNYMNNKVKFYWNNNGSLQDISPFVENSGKEWSIDVLEPYANKYFIENKGKHHLSTLYYLGMCKALEIQVDDKKDYDVPFYEWGDEVYDYYKNGGKTFSILDDNKRLILEKAKKEGKIVFMELMNKAHNYSDYRSFNAQQKADVINYFLKKNYFIVLLSSKPEHYLVSDGANPMSVNYMGAIYNAKYDTRMMFVHSTIESALILREYADLFVSIDSHIPHVANTTLVRGNKDLKGIVFWNPTNPKVFGYPNNYNYQHSPCMCNRSFGLGVHDNFVCEKGEICRNWKVTDVLNKLDYI